MKRLYFKIILLALFFGVLVWSADAVLDLVYFYEGSSFRNLLILNVPAHELYIRTGFIICFLAFGVIVCFLTSRLNRLNEELQEQKENLRTTLYSIGDAVITTDIEGRIVNMNPKAQHLTGWGLDRAISRPLGEIFHTVNAGTGEKCRDPVQKVIETGKAQNLCNDTVLIAGDGTRYQIADSCSPIRDGQDNLTGVVLVFRDVTGQYLQQKSLEESERRFRNLFEQAAIGIFISDKNHNIIDANQRALDILGYSRQEIKKLNARDLLPSEDIEKQSPEEFLKKFLSGEIVEIERKYLKKDGSCINVQVSMRRVEDPGTGSSHMIMFNDITDRKMAEQEKERLDAQLRQAQKMEALGTLTGGIAHDFNNILSIIMGYTELVEEEVHESGLARQGLFQIKDAAIRARDLVRHLLTFSRKEEEEKEPQEIAVIIKEALKMMRSTIPASIEIRQDIAKDLPLVRADHSQIHQLIVNLCKNAADALAEESGTISVGMEHVSLSEDEAAFDEGLSGGEFVKLAVEDTGHGISPEDREKIFDPYFTTKSVDKGTGLGLSVVLGIVKSHHGAIRVESETGKGALFEIYLPIVRQEPEKPEAETGQKLAGGNETILFVDDEQSVVDMNRIRLEKLGYQVKAATGPGRALELFYAHPEQFDLVITDMTMPDMSGDKLSREIFKIRPDMKIILCTGYSEKISADISQELGISAYLEKPIEMGKMAGAIRNVLDRRQGESVY